MLSWQQRRMIEMVSAVVEQHAVTKLSEKAFEKVWDNEDDAEYDNL